MCESDARVAIQDKETLFYHNKLGVRGMGVLGARLIHIKKGHAIYIESPSSILKSLLYTCFYAYIL